MPGRDGPLGRRLVVLVLVASGLITVCLTAVQVAFEYRELRRALDRDLDQVGIYVRSLEGSVWDFDEKQVQRVIDALALNPDVDEVRVTADTGQRWSAGRALPPGADAVTRVYPLHHEHRGERREIARVEVVAGLAGLRRQVITDAASVLLSNALRIALVAAFMVVLVRRLVTSRLERMVGQVRALRPRLLPAEAQAEAPVPASLDELGAVEWGLQRAAEDLDRAVGALRESEGRYRRIVETAREGIWLLDAGGRTTFANQRLAEMLGCTVQELLGAPETDFLFEEEAPVIQAHAGRRRQGLAEQQEVRFQRKDGAALWALVDTTPLFDERGAFAGSMGMVTDVTERRRLEEQLRQSQKLEAVARLAAGVAHDFNNLLTAMLGDAEDLVSSLPPGDPLRQSAVEIQAAAQRAALLTRQLLAFGRKQAAAPRALDLDEVVAAMERLLRRLLGEDVELVTRRASGLWRVHADPGQIEQVIVNLAVNARDAMPGGGRLTIETANAELAGAGEDGAGAPRPCVRLSVRDTGAGMTPEVRAHLFEPFFTTKEPGKGTGLGLSTVHGIVKQCGGDILVESEPGRGSAFHVYLPRADEGVHPAAPRHAPAVPLRGTETVLLLDDEALVRSASARLLRAAGYEVLEAADGEEALGVLAAPGRGIDLLVTDVVLPRLGGPEVAARVRALAPGLPVLFVSGYSDRPVDVRAFGPRTEFLAKPFAPGELARKVRQLLDG